MDPIKTWGIRVLAAFAFAALSAPAAANASTVTMPAGTLVPTGTEITLRSENATFETELGIAECEAVSLKDELTRNSGGIVEAKSVGKGGSTECFIEGHRFTVTDLTIPLLRSATTGSGELMWTGTMDLLGGAIQCNYHGLIPFTYQAGSSVIEAGGELEGTPELCGTGRIDGDLSLSTSSGGAVILD